MESKQYRRRIASHILVTNTYLPSSQKIYRSLGQTTRDIYGGWTAKTLHHASHGTMKQWRHGQKVSHPQGPEELVIFVQYILMVQLGAVELINYFKRYKPSRACKGNKEKKVARSPCKNPGQSTPVFYAKRNHSPWAVCLCCKTTCQVTLRPVTILQTLMQV